MFVDVDDDGNMKVSWRNPERPPSPLPNPSHEHELNARPSGVSPSSRPSGEEELDGPERPLYVMHVPGPDGLLAPQRIRGADGAVFARVSVDGEGRGVYVQEVVGRAGRGSEGMSRGRTSVEEGEKMGGVIRKVREWVGRVWGGRRARRENGRRAARENGYIY